ncbi:UDP-N-acetylmuramoyl-L-alanine--D-glutamate ligase [bacterium]|nr:UDP-N-acetylmuramoyl-L-alanine--D-glutamate ligase [bacterium]
MTDRKKIVFGPEAVPGSRVTVLGAARSGLAAAELLKRHGASVFLSESAPAAEKAEAVQRLSAASIPAEFNGHSDRAFEADWMLVSPGIPPQASALKIAAGKGIPVAGELEAASWYCRAPIVAITGSNGKSTVTALTGEILKAAGLPVVVAGNIGRAFSEDAEKASPDGAAVIEVSSFQMETVRTFRPRVAVFLNLTQDHINWHGSFEAYGRAKARIFENQTAEDTLVVFAADAGVTRLAASARSRIARFDLKPSGDPCGFVRSGVLMLRESGADHELVPMDDLGIRGEHNVLNALASALACRALDVSLDPIRRTLRAFRGLPHRLEFVLECGGVAWINDSKGTNVDSVRYALGSVGRPVILIAGGRDKDSDFTVLRDGLKARARAVILIGEAAGKMEKAFAGACPTERAGSLRESVARARSLARPGDAVLLSPACASFDMFRNFEDRGDQFKALVREGADP